MFIVTPVTQRQEVKKVKHHEGTTAAGPGDSGHGGAGEVRAGQGMVRTRVDRGESGRAVKLCCHVTDVLRHCSLLAYTSRSSRFFFFLVREGYRVLRCPAIDS